jgi:hypothetical protein
VPARLTVDRTTRRVHSHLNAQDFTSCAPEENEHGRGEFDSGVHRVSTGTRGAEEREAVREAPGNKNGQKHGIRTLKAALRQLGTRAIDRR